MKFRNKKILPLSISLALVGTLGTGLTSLTINSNKNNTTIQNINLNSNFKTEKTNSSNSWGETKLSTIYLNDFSRVNQGITKQEWFDSTLTELTNYINNEVVDINKKFFKDKILKSTDFLLLQSELDKTEDWFKFNFLPEISQHTTNGELNLKITPDKNIWTYGGLPWWEQSFYPFYWSDATMNSITNSNWNLKKSIKFGSEGSISGTSTHPYVSYSEGEHSPNLNLYPYGGSEGVAYTDFAKFFINPYFRQISGTIFWDWVNRANLGNTFKFNLNFSKPTLKEDGISFLSSYSNLDAASWKWNIDGDWIEFPGIYDTQGDVKNRLTDWVKNVKIKFKNMSFQIKLPYNINEIKTNLRKFLSQSRNLSQWTDNFTTIANDMIDYCKQNYIPQYLWDAIKFSYTQDQDRQSIRWHVSWTFQNDKTDYFDVTTKFNTPERANLAKIYNDLINYASTPIQLFSNTSSLFDNTSIPTYVNKKLEEELKKPSSTADLPKSKGYIKSNVNINEMSKGSTKNLYAGNSLDANVDWTTDKLISNRQILINYITMLMTNFWNKYSGVFEDGNPDASVSFQTDKLKNQNFINIRFSFKNISNSTAINNQPSPWDVRIPVQIFTTPFAATAGVEDRLLLEGSDVPYIDETTNKVLIKKQTDQIPATANDGFRIQKSNGLTDGGVRLFFSDVNLSFNVREDQTETILVNDVELPILNLEAKTILTGPTNSKSENSDAEKKSGFKEYVIKILDGGSEKYKLKIYIGTSSTPLEPSYYAWNPSSNEEQNKLITPKNPDGSDNKFYVPELNPKTGTITELLWVNQNPNNPMFPDPYDEYGRPTGNSKDGWTPNGFLASGTVINKGIKIDFDETTGNVYRTGLNFDSTNGYEISNNPTSNPNLNNIGNPTNIKPSSASNPYYSYSGHWLYSVKSKFPDQDPIVNNFGTYGIYLVNVIDQSDSVNESGVVLKKYSETLEKDQQIVIPFWQSYHGSNLKNYIKSAYGISDRDIENMDYNTVLGYWNEYSQNGLNLQNSLDKQLNLANLNVLPVKLNSSKKEEIEEIIVDQIVYQLKQWNIVYKDQYDITWNDSDILNLIENYNNQKTSSISVKIVANKNQDKVIGEKTVIVSNSPNLVNLNKLYLPKILINVKEQKTVEQTLAKLKNEIIIEVEKILSHIKIKNEYNEINYVDLKYGIDFEIDWNTLASLIANNDNPRRMLEIEIFAIPTSKYLIGKNKLNVMNAIDIDVDNLVDFSKIKVQNIEFNIAKKEPEKAKIIISNYIFGAIKNAFDEYFNNPANPGLEHETKLKFEWNESIYSTNELVYPKGYGQIWSIKNYEEYLDKLVENINKTPFNNVVQMVIEVNRDSLIGRGGSYFTITNSDTNNPNPDVPNMPDDPNDQIPDLAKKDNLLWIIGVIIPVVFILILILALVIHRIKTRKLK